MVNDTKDKFLEIWSRDTVCVFTQTEGSMKDFGIKDCEITKEG